LRQTMTMTADWNQGSLDRDNAAKPAAVKLITHRQRVHRSHFRVSGCGLLTAARGRDAGDGGTDLLAG
jgi:hypothetical protein